MLNLIINNNNEDRAYPLAVGGSIYPNRLISDISIMVKDQTVTDVYLESVTLRGRYIYILLSGYSEGVYIPLWKASGDVTKSRILSVTSNTTQEAVGWVSLGTIDSEDVSYTGRVRVCRGCLVKPPYACLDKHMYINFSKINAPSVLHLNIFGDTEYVIEDGQEESSNSDSSGDQNVPSSVISIHVNPNADTSLYAYPHTAKSGGIGTLNGTPVINGTITIDLPVVDNTEYDESESMSGLDVSDSSGSGSKVVLPFTVTVADFRVVPDKYRDGPMSDVSCVYKIITIKNNPKLDYGVFKPFTCPSSDILLDNIYINNDIPYELPLDSFIVNYRPGIGVYVPPSDNDDQQ